MKHFSICAFFLFSLLSYGQDSIAEVKAVFANEDQVVQKGEEPQIDEATREVLVPVENTETLSEPVALELKLRNYDGSPDKKWSISGRYLGVLSQVGFEREVYRQISLGLFYGKFQGKVAGTDKLGLIPDLDHLALQVNAYLGEEKSALSTGPVIRFSVHANKQKENDLVKSIQVDGQDVIVPGETKVGTLLGIGYHWQWDPISLNVGIEYLSLGPLKNLVPLAASLGVAF
ncbi:MAG: hypothetical protein K9K67_04005 [Bacteriovoracaceae bacterium]|nr:hypothetical protein [Bacteriovoracaceae bacterium]